MGVPNGLFPCRLLSFDVYDTLVCVPRDLGVVGKSDKDDGGVLVLNVVMGGGARFMGECIARRDCSCNTKWSCGIREVALAPPF